MSIERILKVLSTAATAAAFLCCIFLSHAISDAVYQKLIFCGKIIIPQLFISMAVSSLITEIRPPDFLGGRTRTFFMLMICALCGFPNGAVAAKKFYDTRSLDKNGAAMFCACSGSVSASFMIGYTGKIIGTKAATLLLAIQLAVLTAIYFAKPFEYTMSPHGFCCDAVGAVKNAGKKCIDVCAVITAFSLPSALLTQYADMPMTAEILINGIFEFSSGINAASGNIMLTAIICGFGGICVAAQVKTILGNDISIMPFLAVRAVSAAALGVSALFLT